jgi:phosphoenolpyruvate carboxylase
MAIEEEEGSDQMTTDVLMGRLRVMQRSLATAGFVSLIYDDLSELIADIEKNGVEPLAKVEWRDETLCGTVTILAP